MLKISLMESTTLDFEMIVEGSSTKVESTWLVFESSRGFEIRVPALYEGSRVRCTVPSLRGILENGSTQVHLEVLVNGRLYRPVSKTVTVGTGLQEVAAITGQPATNDFAPSFKALDAIRAATGEKPRDLWAESGIARRFDEAVARKQAEIERRSAEAKKIAASLFASINTNATTVAESKESTNLLKTLRKQIKGK